MLHETYAILAETLSDPTPCLPPGFSGPVSTALGWVKALSLVIGVVALVRIGVHILRQQGDGVPASPPAADPTSDRSARSSRSATSRSATPRPPT